MRLQKICLFFLLALIAPNLFAQTTDISGKYEGIADIQGRGKLPISAEIRQKEGKISGVLNTPLGPASTIEGRCTDGNLLLTLDAGGDDIFLSGKVDADRRISGEVSGAVAKGTFELKR